MWWIIIIPFLVHIESEGLINGQLDPPGFEIVQNPPKTCWIFNNFNFIQSSSRLIQITQSFFLIGTLWLKKWYKACNNPLYY